MKILKVKIRVLGPVPERLISANPGLKFCSTFYVYLPIHSLEENFVSSLLYPRVKAQQYFVSLSYMFVDREAVLKMQLNLELSLTIFRGTGPWLPGITMGASGARAKIKLNYLDNALTDSVLTSRTSRRLLEEKAPVNDFVRTVHSAEKYCCK